MKLLCKLGLHDYGKAHYTEHGMYSNVRDFKQKCGRCGKIIRWTQPKGVDYRYYPKYWSKREYWKYLSWILIILSILFLLRNNYR